MDISQYLRFAAALVFVLGLIAAVAWAARRWGLAGAVASHGRGRVRRLLLVESLAMDAKRRLVLVRRDGVEHLILLGIDGDLLVEGGIEPPTTPPAKTQDGTPAP